MITPTRVEELRGAGLRAELAVDAMRAVQGWVAFDRVESLAGLPYVERVQLPGYARRRTGSVNTEADSLLNADDVRALAAPGPYNGSGIRVGIISDGVSSRSSAIATGDLPASGITIHPTISGSGDEGTAMLEIVHDLAPGAELYFGGPSTSAEMVTVINWMANTVNCQVICDDLGFFDEPWFSDGPIATAARNAVVTSGRVFCSAAGNDALAHYQGLFTNPGAGVSVGGNFLHDFKAGTGVDQGLNFIVNPGQTIVVILQWDDAFGASANDYDLYLLDSALGGLVGQAGENAQDGNDDPFEFATFTNTGATSVQIVAGVAKFSGAAKTLEIYGLGTPQAADDDATSADSIFGHPAVAEVLSAATINASNPGLATIASYSSRGPSTIAFPSAQTRQTPAITALDGTVVTGAGGFSSPFFGTSAAAPHLAGICALMLDKNPAATPTQIRAALMAGAIDKGTAGFDNTFGNGLADALGGVTNTSGGANSPPTTALPGPSITFTENAPASILDSTATVSDADSTDFNTGTLTVDFTANGTAEDRLAIRNEGAGAGQIGVSGANVNFGGVTIGTFTGGTSGASPLVVTFNSASATPAAAQALARNITYQNVSDAPSTLARTVRFAVTDGDGGTSAAATKTVNVTAVNDVPTLAAISNPAAILEDAVAQTVNLSGIAAGGGETQVLTVTATSDNTALIPNPTVTYTSPNATGSLSYTPVANASGSAVISVTVMDNGGTANGGINLLTRTFMVNVTAVNDAPTLAAISDPAAILEDAVAQTVNLSGIGAGGGETQVLTVTATSNNTALIPNPTVTYTSPNAMGSLSYTPVANANGSAVITVTVMDSGGTANGGVDLLTRTFTVNVTAVNDPPEATNLSAAENYTEDAVRNLTDIVMSDIDSASVTATLTLSNAAAGILSTGTSGAVTSTFSAGEWSASGAIADVNTLLAGVTFDPAADFNANFSIATSVSDGVAAAITGNKAMTGTAVNDTPSFTKGPDNLHPAGTNTVQSFPGWATAISAGPADEAGQTLTFNVSVTGGASLFTTAPAIASNGTLTYRPNGTAGAATMSVTLSDNGGGANTSAAQTFSVTVQAAADYTVATTGGAIVVTDVAGNGDTLALSQPVAGSIQFAAAGRTFSVNGGLSISGNSGSLPLAGVNSITVNAAAGEDTINIGSFTVSPPGFTINGGTGNDTVNFNGDITFATNANLDVDLQNDDAVPGTDAVAWAANANVLLSGTGAATVKCSQGVTLNSSASLEVVNGPLVVEANQQAIRTTGNFHGVYLNSGMIRSNGTGQVTVKGKGGDDNVSGVRVQATGGLGGIRAGTTGTLVVEGRGANTGGAGFGLRGVHVSGTSNGITSTGANVQVTGIGGSGTGFSGVSNCDGVLVDAAVISAGGTGNVTVNGTTGGLGGQDRGVYVASTGAAIRSNNGNVSIFGQGGANGSSNFGVRVDISSSVSAGGTGSLTLEGVNGGTAGNPSDGILLGSGGSPATISANFPGTITLISDSLSVGSVTNISAVSSQVIIRQRTNGTAIDLGSAGGPFTGTLQLSDAELDRITCGTLRIGDANSGAITQSAAISRPANTAIALTSSAAIVLNTGPLDSLGGNVTLDPGGATNTFSPTASGTDIAMSSTGTVSFGSGDRLAIAISAATVDTGYRQLKVTGNVDLTGVTLSLSGSFTPSAGNRFTVVDNDGSDPITGTFTGLAQGAIINFNGVPLELSYTGGTGNDVTLSDFRPGVAVNNATVGGNEGGVVSNTGTFVDWQGNGTVTLSASIGALVQNNGAGTWSWSFAGADGPAGPTTVTITATDTNSLTSNTSFTVTVNNVAPIIALTGAGSTDEGSSYALDLGAITDPGMDTVTAYSINWGDGTTDNFTGNPTGTSKLHTYADGAANFTITVSLTDEDGTFGSTKPVSVANVAPSAIAQTGAGAVHTMEDAPASTITMAASDPAGALDAYSVAIVAGSLNPPSAGTLGGVVRNDVTFTPAANFFGTATFQFDATDDDDATGPPATIEIVVAPVNDPPIASADTLTAVDEDSGLRTISFGALTDNDSAGPGEAGQARTVIAVGSAVGGSVAINGSEIRFTPAANFNGIASFSYTMQDNGQTGNPPMDDFKSASATASFTINPVNDVPVFTSGGNQVVIEDAGAQSVADWAAAISAGPADESGQAVSFIVSNDNNALFAVQPVVAANGTLTYTAAANANGSAIVSVQIHDDGGTANSGVDTSAAQTFTISVTAVNDAPTLTSVTDPAAILEDAAVQIVNLAGISAGGGETQTLSVTASSDNPALIPDPTVDYTSANATGALSYTPVADMSGSAVITVTVQDNGGTADGGVNTIVRTFTVNVTAVNDAPTLTAIANPAAILEDAAVQTINLTGIGAGGGETQALTVTATSDNPAVIPNPSVTYTSASETGSLRYAPVGNANGSAVITVTVQDDGGTTDGGVNTITRTFTVNVTAVNDAPTLAAIAAPAAILEDAGLQTIDLTGIGAGGGETQVLTVTATSDNTALVPNPTVTYTSPNATGSLGYTPVANASGSAVITVTVMDNGGTANGGVDLLTRTFTVNVTAVNDVPTLVAIDDPAAILEDAVAQTVNLSGIAAGGGETQVLTVTATSNNTALVPNPTVTYTSPNAMGSLGYTPVANASGSAVITVTVMDNGGTANGGVDLLTRTFTVNVTAVNDAPTLVAIDDPAAIMEDAVAQTVNVSGIAAGGGETHVLTVTATSNNTALIPDPTVTYTSPNAMGSLSYTPVANANGSAVITVTVMDNGGTANGGVDLLTRTFTVNVTAVNDVPTLAVISNPAAILEDAVAQTVNLTGIAAGGGETQVLTVTATSDNTALIPNPTVTYTSPNATGSLGYTPVANASGSAVITVTVMDNGGTANGGVNLLTRTFTVNVTAVNDVPTLAAIDDPVAIVEDAVAQMVNLSGISAGGGETQTLTVTATSDNAAVIADPTVDYASSAATGSLSYTPVPDANGAATITVTIMDDGGTAGGGVNAITRSFVVNVTPVNDAPSFTKGANVVVFEDAAAQTVAGLATAISPGPADEAGQTVSFTVSNDNAALFSVQPVVAPDGTLTYTPAVDASGTASVSVRAVDTGGTGNGGVDTSAAQTFTIMVTGVNDAPSFVAGPRIDAAQDSGPRSIPAWATAINPGAGESGQSVTFIAAVDKPELFATLPTITPGGTLAFVPAPGGSGIAIMTVRLQDDGGTANGGVDTSPPQMVEIAITSVLEELGSYTGLVQPAAGGTRENARTGSVQVKLTKTGKFSGRLMLAGKRVAMKGVVGHDGVARFGRAETPSLTISRTGLPPLDLALTIEVARGTNTFGGMLKQGGAEFAGLEGDRALYTSKRNPAPPMENVPSDLPRNFTVILPALTAAEQGRNASTYPQGDGFGRLTVSKRGVAKFSGTLADGKKVSAAAPVAKSGRWPFYKALGKTGSVSGFAFFRDVAVVSDVDAMDVLWFKPPNPRARQYPDGWPGGIFFDLVGAEYTAPTRRTPGPVLPGLGAADGDGNAELSLNDGGIAGLAFALSIDANNRPRFLTQPVERPTIALSAKTGLLKGRFIHSVSGRKAKYGGAVLQKQKLGSGFFLGPTESGSVTLVPDDDPGTP
ncbi:MAG: tandem-95 repeat protein [Chthoniobacteraceae bacterium]